MVGRYFDEHRGSIPTKKLHLAAIRGLFDKLVTRHVMVLNPASSVRGERYKVIEGKTPEIAAEQARALLAAIRTSKTIAETGNVAVLAVGLRDTAIIACLIYTAARAGAVARLRMRDLAHDGTQYLLRFAEKGGKSREIPVRHDLQGFLLNYLTAGGLADAQRDSPLFRSADRRTGRLTENAITGQDICRMVKRRLKDAGLPTQYSPHSFRVATITDLLIQGAPLEDVQFLAGHADPRVTRLYDRRHKLVTRKIVDKISI
jgi:site-specific recombinase XerD